MGAAIDLDRKAGINAKEVEYIGAEGLLPPEFPTIDLPIAQPRPKLRFSTRFATSQRTRKTRPLFTHGPSGPPLPKGRGGRACLSTCSEPPLPLGRGRRGHNGLGFPAFDTAPGEGADPTIDHCRKPPHPDPLPKGRGGRACLSTCSEPPLPLGRGRRGHNGLGFPAFETAPGEGADPTIDHCRKPPHPDPLPRGRGGRACRQ